MNTPKRYQCRHIFTEGRRCGSPSLRGEDFCYYHHTTRRPAPDPRTREDRSAFDLPLPEDRSAIQLAIGHILLRIAHNQIDAKRAGLLLYGLQIASSNLPRQSPEDTKPPQVEEITTHPELGLLAPPAEYDEAIASGRPRSIMSQLIEDLTRNKPQAAAEEPGCPILSTPDRAMVRQSHIPNPGIPNPTSDNPAQPAILPTLDATAESVALLANNCRKIKLASAVFYLTTNRILTNRSPQGKGNR